MFTAWSLLWSLAACHLGRPPTADQRYQVGELRGATVEPALPEALSAALAGALARRGVLGSGPRLQGIVLDAATNPVALDPGGVQVFRARLRVAWELTGPTPARLVVQAERSYTIQQGETAANAAARAEAFSVIAYELAEDAVTWLLYGVRR